MAQAPERNAHRLDRVGAYAGAICAVHCLLTGAALGLLSVVGLGFLGSPAAEAIFLLVAVAVGTLAIVHGIRRHHSYVPATIFVVGLLCLVSGHFLFGHSHRGGMSTLFSVAGGLCIVAFHVLNARLARTCGCNHCHAGD